MQLRDGEAATVLLMFLYSFLAMAGYNMIKPVTRGLFIEKLGAENLPWIQFGAGIVIGFIMQAYTRVIGLAPRRWMIPVTLTGIVASMSAFFVLFGQLPDNRAVAVAFYLFGLIVGILLISQFWTLANDVYDPRQAKRVFGFIGAGASLGGFAGASLTSSVVQQIGTNSVLLLSAITLAICTVTAAWVRPPGAHRGQERREQDRRRGERERLGGDPPAALVASPADDCHGDWLCGHRRGHHRAAAEHGRGRGEGCRQRRRRHRIPVAGGGLHLAHRLRDSNHADQPYSSLSRHRLRPPHHPSRGFGDGPADALSGALWTSGMARVADTSLRYTVDKTTREILFLPLPVDIKYQAKPFIDVTVDRVAKGVGALILLVLVQPWGLPWAGGN